MEMVDDWPWSSLVAMETCGCSSPLYHYLSPALLYPSPLPQWCGLTLVTEPNSLLSWGWAQGWSTCILVTFLSVKQYSWWLPVNLSCFRLSHWFLCLSRTWALLNHLQGLSSAHCSFISRAQYPFSFPDASHQPSRNQMDSLEPSELPASMCLTVFLPCMDLPVSLKVFFFNIFPSWDIIDIHHYVSFRYTA